MMPNTGQTCQLNGSLYAATLGLTLNLFNSNSNRNLTLNLILK